MESTAGSPVKSYVYGSLHSEKTKNKVHALRVPYADASLPVGPQVQALFATAQHQGELQISDIRRNWRESYESKNYLLSWESVPTMQQDVPAFLKPKLKKNSINKKTRAVSKKTYGNKLQFEKSMEVK